MISTEIKNIIESVIFASEDEITSKQIKDVIDKSGLRVSLSEIEESVNSINEELKSNNKPFEILRIAGGFSFATKKEYGRFIGKLFEDKQRKKLSQSALETLSIIAYKQPITRSDIEFIRGVNVDYIVNSLLEKDLITIIGRAETPGRPILYGTTKAFLKILGLNALEDLPKLKEINEILKNQEIEGITEADIELFNSINIPDNNNNIQPETSHQLELLTNENAETFSESELNSDINSIDENSIDENSIDENITDEDITDEDNTDEDITDEDITDEDLNIEISEVTDSENSEEDLKENNNQISESEDSENEEKN